MIGTPTYFPLMDGGVGLAGEAGPGGDPAAGARARRPARRRSRRAARGANVTIQIATPDVESFRRSESYITGQIARAVARGQRSL